MEYWVAVVDDEALSLTNARNLLSEENMKVSCLRSGKDLLKFLEKNKPDLILMDILMPEMDGFETFSALRRFEDENNRMHTPVIFLTGENDSEVERRGLSAGASDFIRKPFNKDILVKRIHNTISNRKTIEILTEEATVDKLTGFLNKASGNARTAKLCNEQTGALVILDLDSFKLVNDLFGHDMGDKVLKAFSDVVRRNTRETDVISRIGGDEFMGFFSELIEKDAVAALSERLNTQLVKEAARLMGEDNGIPLGVSVGVVMVPEHGRDFESLFALADSSLYTVKQNGKHGYSIFGRSGENDEVTDDDLEKEMGRLTQILEERNDTGDAMLLGREAFAMAYRFLIRYCKDYGGRFDKILFSLSPDGETEKKDILAASSEFEDILHYILRRSDLIMRNRSDSFFVLLNGRTKEEAASEIERVIGKWKESGYGSSMNVEYSSGHFEYSADQNADTQG